MNNNYNPYGVYPPPKNNTPNQETRPQSFNEFLPPNNNYPPQTPPINYQTGYSPPIYSPPGYSQGGYYQNYNQKQNQQKLLKKPISRSANAISGGLLIMLVISTIISVLFKAITEAALSPIQLVDNHELLESIHSALSYFISLFAVYIITANFIGIPLSITFPSRKIKPSTTIAAVFICLGASILGSFAGSMISALIENVFGYIPIMPDFTPPKALPSVIIYFISVAIMPAFLEEIIFRGVILQSLRRFGDTFALVTSAIMFSLFHGNLIQGPPTFVIGLLIGYFVLRTGSIWIGIVIHFVNNALAVCFDLYAQTLPANMEEALNGFIVGIYLLGGVIALLYMLFKQKHNVGLHPSKSPLSEGQKYRAFFFSAATIVFLVIMIAFTISYMKPVLG